MEKYVKLLTIALLFISISSLSQLYNDGIITVEAGSSITVSNDFINEVGAQINIDGTMNCRADWINNAVVANVNGSINFNGSAAKQSIGGSQPTNFTNVSINNASDVQVMQNIKVNGFLSMIAGDFDLRNSEVDLGTAGNLSGELSTKRVKATDGLGNDGIGTGVIKASRDINISTSNLAGLGVDVYLASGNSLGTSEIIRGHKELNGTGIYAANTSIHRNITVNPEFNVPSTVRFYYHDLELDGNTENLLNPYMDVVNHWNTVTKGFFSVTTNWVQYDLSTDYDLITLSSSPLGEDFDIFSVKVFLEGPFNNAINEMYSGLISATQASATDPFPLTQPYSSYMVPPPVIWETPYTYGGIESVANYASIPAGAVDWVVLSIYDDSWSNPSANIVFETAGFLMNDGSIVNTEGGNPRIASLPVGTYYAVVHHRNHLGVNSRFTMDYANNTFSYDFTDAGDKAHYIDPPPLQLPVYQQKEVVPGVWAMFSGDGSANGSIDATDANMFWTPFNLNFGNYLQGDFNLSGDVGSTDSDVWLLNNSKYSVIPYL